ncbi:hypothetical protein IMX12_13260 [Streptomyces sp. Babs14]|uniref:hypothetical protein n=1 Tax=unclassified Streptomyces TaxID=2593676 RepID=UPI001C24D25F|nr:MULTISPECIES: hypothetical protein [unclassified Streptomyces]MBU8549777.1 hypothetical protein [Streptomyces sp. Osf17]MBU8556560.1 hypothetical protein [Streptomyces sp. Babs14]
MSRLSRPATRLATGSAATAHRLAARTAAWVRRGRRDDLTGWRAALGCWLRLALLVLGGYLLWRLVRAVPNLLWPLTGTWLIASWRAGRNTSAPATAEAPAEPDVEAVRTLLLEAMGDADAVHLRTVLAHLQERGQGTGWTVADLRARLEALHIPVQPKVKVPGSKSPTRGVRRADLAPSPAAAEEASHASSTAA